MRPTQWLYHSLRKEQLSPLKGETSSHKAGYNFFYSIAVCAITNIFAWWSKILNRVPLFSFVILMFCCSGGSQVVYGAYFHLLAPWSLLLLSQWMLYWQRANCFFARINAGHEGWTRRHRWAVFRVFGVTRNQLTRFGGTFSDDCTTQPGSKVQFKAVVPNIFRLAAPYKRKTSFAAPWGEPIAIWFVV